MTTETKTQLRRGHDYQVELYPFEDVKTAFYLREYAGQHIFSGGGDYYIIMDDHWMTQKDGKITYKDISSFSVHFVLMDEVRNNGGIEKYIDKFFGVKK